MRAEGADLLASDRSRYAVRFVGSRRLDAEGVRKPNKKAEQRGHISGFGDLLFAPASVAKPLHLLVRDPVGGLGYGAGEIQQQAFGPIEAGGIEVTVSERIRHPLELSALQLQEPRV